MIFYQIREGGLDVETWQICLHNFLGQSALTFYPNDNTFHFPFYRIMNFKKSIPNDFILTLLTVLSPLLCRWDRTESTQKEIEMPKIKSANSNSKSSSYTVGSNSLWSRKFFFFKRFSIFPSTSLGEYIFKWNTDRQK